MGGFLNKALGTAAGISGMLATISVVLRSEMWCIGIPWSLCSAVAIPMAKAKVNVEILNPKGMNLQCYGCFAHKIVRGVTSSGSVGNAAQPGGVGAPEAQTVAAMEEFEE